MFLYFCILYLKYYIMMRNKLAIIILGMGLFFIFQAKLNATTYPELNHNSFQIKRDTQYVLPENEEIIKAQLIDKLKIFNILSTVSLVCIPGSIISFGLSLIAGFVISIVATINFFQIRAILNEYPGFEDDPNISKKVFKSYLKFIFLISIYGLLIALFLFLLASFLFFDFFLGTTILFATIFLAMFLMFDKLIFNSKPK